MKQSSAADLTARQRQAGLGMSHARLFVLCGHKGGTSGAQYRRGIGWLRCAACNAARRPA